MAEVRRSFAYVALSASGARTRGRLEASTEAAAFERLRLEGLSPLSLKANRGEASARPQRIGLSDRRAAELFTSLGQLLSAGADIRSALSMLSERPGSRSAGQLCRSLLEAVSGGTGIDVVLAERLQPRQGFVAALAAAAQASGDLGAGFVRSGAVLAARDKLKSQLVSTLSYPVFVLASSLVAVLVILLFVVPTLAPLVTGPGTSAPATLTVLLWMSRTLSDNLISLGVGIAGVVVILIVLQRFKLLAAPVDRALLDGPSRRVRSGLVYGAVSGVLGDLLAAGAPLGDALRLAVRTAPSGLARQRLEAAAAQVRQGQLLSTGLSGVVGFPPAILRLCAVGERSGALGQMLSRAGRLEEEEAFRKLETMGRLLGPILIVILGALVGLMMAALLSGLSQIGQNV